MNPISHARTVLAGIAVSLAVLVAAGPGQIALGGNVYDGSGGPLVPGSVYMVNGNHVTVPAGQTLTVQPGVIVKCWDNRQWNIDGTLLVNGTAADPVIFTSYRDDTAGGDTNGDGPSAGVPDDWRSLIFGDGSDASVLTHAIVRYGGDNYHPLVDLWSADITLTDCTLAYGSQSGLNLWNTTSRPVVSGCAFIGNAVFAVAGATIDSVPGFVGNTASGNAGGNYIHVSTGTLGADRTIGAANCLGGALMIAAHLSIPVGLTLTLQAGAVLKFPDNVQVNAAGRLLCGGTAADPVVFTSHRDDDYGGDTNNDGPSSGVPDDWRGLIFADTADGSVLDHVVIRHGGDNYLPLVDLWSADITLADCVLAYGSQSGMNLRNTSARPVVTGCAFEGNAVYAVEGATIDSVPGFAGNTASGNGGNYINVTSGTLVSDRTIGPQNCLGGAIVFPSHLVIPAGRTLTLQPGAVLKFPDNVQVNVDGTLLGQGTAADPVVFTSIRDDVYGGDTNNNGFSAGVPDDWRALIFSGTSDASVLDHVVVRYGGDNFLPLVDLWDADITVRDCTFAFGSHAGMRFRNTLSRPAVTGCTFADNVESAVDLAPLDAVPGFINNSAARNGGGNYIRVTAGTLGANSVIGPENCLGGVLWISAHLVVPAGLRLGFRPGAILKFQDNVQVDVAGAMDLLGTAWSPVVFTSYRDDAWGGDTNNNGPSTGVPDDWRGITYAPSAAASRIENAFVRFGGDNAMSSLWLASPNVVVQSVRVEHASHWGIRASALAGDAKNWVAFDCYEGIWLESGTFQLLHATVAGSTQRGIFASPAYGGSVFSSIAWGNGGGNFTGLGPGRLFSCDGSAVHAGANGNINLDPLFVDPSSAAGDLHLGPGSPCLNTGDILAALATVKDWDENSRGLDHDLTGMMLPDMGAFERAAYVMLVAGVPRIGTGLSFVVGGGPAGQSVYAIGRADAAVLLIPYGMVTAGFIESLYLWPYLVPTGQPVQIDLPADPALVGLTPAIQTVTAPDSNPLVGNITALYRATIRP